MSLFRSITKSYYRNSVGAVLAYDICNKESYKVPVCSRKIILPLSR